MSGVGNVFLVGPMGAGKTTIGRHLARELGCEFLDTDTEIERRTGTNIPWIFDVEGEHGFRDREQQVVEELSARRGCVLATGGGAILRPANRRCLAARGQVVYLYATLAQQLRRTRRDRNRPLLQRGDPAATLAALMAERDPLYREIADLVVPTEDGSPRMLALRVLQQLQAAGGIQAAPQSAVTAHRSTQEAG